MNASDELRKEIQSYLQQYGLKIFSLRDKAPEAKGWQEIDEFVLENKPFGVHFTEESTVIVVDVDDMRLLSHFKHFFDRTYCVQTGRGFHIYIAVNAKGKEPIHHFINDKKQKIDILSSGGYVVGETSEHYDKDESGVYFKTGKEYKLLSKDREIKTIDYNKEIKPILKKLGFNLKKTPIRKRNVKALENGVETGNRNNELFALACNNLKSGVSPETVYDNICYINQKSKQPLSEDELEQLFQSAVSIVKGQMEESNTVHKIDDKTTHRLTDKEPEKLRPLTLNSDDEKFILTYIYTDEEVAERKDKTVPLAYFITNGKLGRRLVSYENKELQDRYISNIYKSYPDLLGRIKLEDILSYTRSETEDNPKKLFEDMLKLERKYFDNEFDYDYYYEACWKAHTYFYTLFPLTPYNDYTGMKNTGKTKRLTLNSMMCFNAWSSGDTSVAALFRTIEGTGATMILDETEMLGDTKSDNQELQSILRNGFQKTGRVTRTEKDTLGNFIPRSYEVFSPKCFAHINPLANVLQDRCITTRCVRSYNKIIANSEPDETDTLIYSCRNRLYFAWLDHAIEVRNLIPEAMELFQEVSGRELKLWLPIVTMALFFEKHGVENLVHKIMSKLRVNSEEKKENDLEENDQLKILTCIMELPPDDSPQQSSVLYGKINQKLSEKYSIDKPLSGKELSQSLKHLGFTWGRKNSYNCWLNVFDPRKIEEAKVRCGMISPTQTTLGDSGSSGGSVA